MNQLNLSFRESSKDQGNYQVHRMKTLMLISTVGALFVALSSLAQAKDPNVKAYCNDAWKQSTPGWTSIASQHGVTIINKTSTVLVYDVYFDNLIQYPKSREMPLDYSESPYTPNAHQEHHFRIEAGKTFHYGEVTIEKIAGFPRRGHYKTASTTVIKFNGVLLDNCIHYNSIDIV